MSAPPAGRNDGDVRSRRERILDAATSLFAARGVDATSTQAIAEHAGVAVGSVFYHFDTKAELLRTLVAERSFAPQLSAMLERTQGDIETVLTQVGHAFLATLRERHELVRILLQTAAIDREHGHILQDLIRNELGELAKYLQQVPGLDLDEAAAVAAARTFISTLLVGGVLVPLAEDVPSFVDDVVAIVLHGAMADRSAG